MIPLVSGVSLRTQPQTPRATKDESCTAVEIARAFGNSLEMLEREFQGIRSTFSAYLTSFILDITAGLVG